LLVREIQFNEFNTLTFFKNQKHACSLGKISVFKDEVLNDTIGDEVLGWFEGK
jgi:hypothetical protein